MSVSVNLVDLRQRSCADRPDRLEIIKAGEIASPPLTAPRLIMLAVRWPPAEWPDTQMRADGREMKRLWLVQLAAEGLYPTS